MKYFELLTKSNLVNHIPLCYNGIKLDPNTAANVVLLKVAYNKLVEDKKNENNEAIKALKNEGFDERAVAINEMRKTFDLIKDYNEWYEGKLDSEGNEVKKPEMPSEEAIKKAEESKLLEEDFIKEEKELIEAANKVYEKSLLEDIEFNKGLNKEDWKNIYEMLGVEGTISVKIMNSEKSIDLDKSIFLQYIGELIND